MTAMVFAVRLSEFLRHIKRNGIDLDDKKKKIKQGENGGASRPAV
jgi:hypothetical protein